jgi:transcriptional regulator with XRE-family HTH domain
LGEKLKALRCAEHQTLKEVSDALDLADGHLAAIESGKTRNPGISVVVALADYYGVSLDSLVSAREQLKLNPETSAVVRVMEEQLSHDDRQLMLKYVRLFAMHKEGSNQAEPKAS